MSDNDFEFQHEPVKPVLTNEELSALVDELLAEQARVKELLNRLGLT